MPEPMIIAQILYYNKKQAARPKYFNSSHQIQMHPRNTNSTAQEANSTNQTCFWGDNYSEEVRKDNPNHHHDLKEENGKVGGGGGGVSGIWLSTRSALSQPDTFSPPSSTPSLSPPSSTP